MKIRIIISLAIIGLISAGGAYAMTGQQAIQMSKAALNGNAADLAELEAAAKSGDAAAQLWFGSYWGAKKDYVKATYWFQKAADQGNASAENNLGVAYSHGQGVPQDEMVAITWWKKAAAQGGPAGRMAQHNINIAEGR